MKAFNKLDISFDVQELKRKLENSNDWDEHPQRRTAGTIHSEMTDIWVRYKDPAPHIASGDWSTFADEHESVWLKDYPKVKAICNELMKHLEGSQLGGVLITKLPPNGFIEPHTDSGWHAEYYDKYYVAIKNAAGARFCFEDGFIEPEEGEVNAFRNDKVHWVENKSGEDRIAMIVCIKQNKLSKEGLCLGQQQQQ